jgi:hypothetical protein
MPKGEHVVDFEYRPGWITPAILLSLLGCATLIILLLLRERLLKKLEPRIQMDENVVKIQGFCNKVLANLEKVIVGKKHVLEQVLLD